MFSALSHFVFGASSLFSSHDQADAVKTNTWKDKKLCFDLRPHDLELTSGEQLIGCFYPIEDVKGNQDELGVLEVTNLRLVWACVNKKRVNLSIGWRTVTLVYEQNLKDSLCDSSASLFVLCKYESTKYEFVFARQSGRLDIWANAEDPECWRVISHLRQPNQDRAFLVSHLSPMYLDDPFEVVLKVWQAYKQTHLFRHCRSNLGNLVSRLPAASEADVAASDVVRLPCEESLQVFGGVSRRNSRAGTFMGTLYLTNVRFIWIDNMLHARNLSIPWIRINSLKMKQGRRVVVKTSDYLSSSTQVELQLGGTPMEAKTVFEELQRLYLTRKAKPRFGPESCDDCLTFMTHLRPLELFFQTLGKSTIMAMENLGPPVNLFADPQVGAKTNQTDTKRADSAKQSGKTDKPDSDEIDQAERDLDGYATKLARYLNERPLDLDNELIYSADLGLAMEKPAGDLSISSIWRIDV